MLAASFPCWLWSLSAHIIPLSWFSGPYSFGVLHPLCFLLYKNLTWCSFIIFPIAVYKFCTQCYNVFLQSMSHGRLVLLNFLKGHLFTFSSRILLRRIFKYLMKNVHYLFFPDFNTYLSYLLFEKNNYPNLSIRMSMNDLKLYGFTSIFPFMFLFH